MEVIPHVGIGKVRLGMAQQEAECLHARGVHLDFTGSPPVVVFIEVDKRAGAVYRRIRSVP